MKLHLPLSLFRALKRCYSWAAPLVATTALTLSMQEVQALDATEGSVSYGEASISQAGTDVLITQSSSSTIINWTDFNIPVGQTVTFSQDIDAVALNRVTGTTSTEIWGSLIADGNIFIINPNGILFGAGSTVDVAGLVASTLDISDGNFKSGNYSLEQQTGSTLASIVNNGTIKAGDDGFIYLVGARVENGDTGSLIVGKSGTVGVGAGTSATIDFSGTGLVSFEVTGTIESKLKDGSDPGVENKGSIQAVEGGKVIMTADVKREVVTSVINNSGSVEANSLDDILGMVTITGTGGAVSNTSTGSITAAGGKVVIEGDSVDNSGTISTAATDGTEDGTVYITATEGAITGTGTASNIITENLYLYTLSTDGGSIGSVYVYDVDGSDYITLTPLNTQVSNLYVETKSSLQDDGLASGNVGISNSNAGDLYVNINTNKDNLDGAGLSTVQIVNNDGGLTGTIIAHSGDLTAYGSISLEPSAFTSLSAAVSYSGDISIDNVSDYLTINSMSVAYEGEAAFDASKNQVHKEGSISLSQTGTLVIAGSVMAGENVTLSSSANHLLTSLSVVGEGDDATVLSLGTVYANAIDLSAAGKVGDGLNIVVGGVDDVDAGLSVSAGTITIGDVTAGGVNLKSSSEINVKQITATGTEGNVTLTTSVGDISLNADAGFMAIDATGSISLESELGAIYSYGQAGAVALNGTSVSLSAYLDILHMNDDDSTANLTTSDAVTKMTLNATYGSIGITRGLSSSTVDNDLWVSATADADINIIQNGGGDMSLYLISGEGSIYVQSSGSIGLNNIEALDENAVVEVTAAGDVSLSGKISAGAGITVESTGGSISDAANSTLTTSSVGSFVELFAAKDAFVDDSTINTEERATIMAQGGVSLGNITAKGTDYTNDGYVLADPVVDSVIEVQAGTSLAVTGSLSSEEYIILHAETGAITAGENNSLSTNQLLMKAESGIASSPIPLNTSVSYLAAESTSGDIMLDNTDDLTVYATTVPSSSNVLAGVTISGVSTSSSGDITLEADSIYIDAAMSTAGDNSVVTLTATVGDITGTDNPYVFYHIEGESAILTAQSGIGSDAVALRSNIGTLKAEVQATGNINMVEADDITVTEVDTADGSITLVAGGSIIAQNVISETDSAAKFITLQALAGNITVGSILAGESEGKITLIASGKILNDGNTATEISANDLDITAGTGIGVDWDDAVTALNTNVASLTAVTTKGSVHIDEQNDILINKITATDEVTVTSTEGSLTVIDIDTAPSENEDTNITLIAKNAILNGRNDTLAALKADELNLTAGTGIGTSEQAMDVEAESLAAESTSGGIYISDLEGDLTITSVSSNLGLASPTGVQAKDGEIVVETAGALSIEQLVEASSDVELTAKGGDITAKATVSTTSAGDLSMSAEGSITALAALSATSGEITLDANKGSISTSNQASITADEDIFLTATGGAITLNAEIKSAKAGDILLTATELAGQSEASNITLNAAMSTEDGYIALTADGAVDINDSVKAQDVTEGDHNLIAPIAPVDGELHITADTTVSIDASLSAVEDITILAGNGSITSTADILTTKGDITLTTQEEDESVDANITLDGFVQAENGSIFVTSVDDIITTTHSVIYGCDEVAMSAEVSIETNGRVTSYGNVSFLAGTNITIKDDVSAGTELSLKTLDGSIESIAASLSASSGDIFIESYELDEATDASITLDGNVTASTKGLYVTSSDHITTTEDCAIETLTGVQMVASGNIETNGSIQSNAIIKIDAFDGAITINGAITSKMGNIALYSYKTEEAVNAHITIDNSLTADAGAVIIDSMDGVTTTENGDITTGAETSILAEAEIELNGTITATGALSYVLLQSNTASITLNDDIQSVYQYVIASAESDIWVNSNIQAATFVRLASDAGSITGDMDMAGAHITAPSLEASAATGVTLKTDVDEAYGYVTATGDFVLEEKDSIEGREVIVNNGSITVTAGGSIDATYLAIAVDDDSNDISLVAQDGDIKLYYTLAGEGAQGDVSLSAIKGSITQDTDASLVADNLTAEAGGSITMINTVLQSADSLSTQTGAISLVENDGIDLGQINAAGGAADVTITVGGDINDLYRNDSLDTQLTNITADKLSISAEGSIGNIDKLELDVNSVVTATEENLYLVQKGDLVIEQIKVGGTVNITSTEGSINGNPSYSLNIEASDIILEAETGIGNESTLLVESDSLDAQTSTGDISIESDGDLNLNLITTGDGTVSLVINMGAILDNNGDAINIEATSAELKALNGIDPDDALETSLSSLSAETTDGGIAIINSGKDLTLEDIYTATGDITVTQETGSLSISQDINLPAGNNITLSAADAIYQNADLITGDGDISLTATNELAFADGVKVDAGTGTLTLVSNMLNGLPIIDARYVRVYTLATANKFNIAPLFDDHRRIDAIWLNNRIVGGLVSDNATFINEPFAFTHEKHDMGYSLLYQNGDYNKSIIDVSAYEIDELMNIKSIRTWVYGADN